VTQPAPAQQPPSNQQAVLAAASVLATAATVAEAAAILGPFFAGLKIRSAALHAALTVVMERPPDRTGFYGPATAQTARLNLIRRSQFMVNSARRFNETLARVAAGGADPREIFEQMAAERRYYGMHQEAVWNRMQAAAVVDSRVMDYGPLLGWYSVNDRRTSPECRRAHRHNFRADDMPPIGFPGAVHPHCRCWPGPPIPGAPLLGGGQRLPTRMSKRAARKLEPV
jgi:SPP1 gp7 family putative phage head morphogenesis protein